MGGETRGPEDGEFAKIRRLAALFGAQSAPGVTVGIGDDAAVLDPPPGRKLVWTVDAQVEGRHFRRAWMTFADVGWRSFVAAASDLASMGADPWCALGSLALPADVGDGELGELTRGQAEAALDVGCPLVGGNLTRAGELSLTTTLLGTVERAVLRTGAREGDGVWIAGAVGLAGAGLRALIRGDSAGELDAAVAAFRRPPVLFAQGRAMRRSAHAAIDVSDGLAQDVGHLASASGVAVVLDEASLTSHAGEALARAARALRERVLDLVLAGGEDYALVATSSEPIAGFTRIGDVEPGEGVWLRAGDGSRRPVGAPGFDHFGG